MKLNNQIVENLLDKRYSKKTVNINEDIISDILSPVYSLLKTIIGGKSTEKAPQVDIPSESIATPKQIPTVTVKYSTAPGLNFARTSRI
jgi:hypothetical protein